jgi:BCD family chlorophyll transporter-like MFS transporter
VLVLLNGTLNRVMIVEMGIPAWLVAALVALPVLFAPFRALIGFKSDHHKSALGWRRVPYIWFGTLLQFGGLAMMPFALLVLSGRGTHSPALVGEIAAAAAFLLAGAGMHMVQTAGVSLATDLAPQESRPRVVALLYVMLLVGMVAASLAFGGLLRDFGYTRLVQVVQGSAVATVILNIVALWRQEVASGPRRDEGAPFSTSFRELLRGGRHDAAASGGRPRRRRLQHAGHPPRALRRRAPRPVRERDDGADGDDGRRHPDRPDHRGPDALARQ